AMWIFCLCRRISRWRRSSPQSTAIGGRKTYASPSKRGGPFGDAVVSYVFSRTLPTGRRDGVTVTRKPPSALVGEIRRRPGKNIWLMGGGELAREFLQADLVDELFLGVVPVLLGEGIPLFPAGFPQRGFALIETKNYSKVWSKSSTGEPCGR